MKNKKKIVTALAGLALVGAVGGTFAYFNSSATFENIFHTAGLGVKYTENFVSPDNWQPGDTTPKTLTVKNESTVPLTAKIKIVKEEWKKDDTVLPLKQNDVEVAVKDINTTDWIKHDDYYYYKKTLQPGETSTTFINSVTYNADTDLSTVCTPTGTIGEGTYSVTCTGGEYSGATYTLKLQVETVQASQEIFIYDEDEHTTPTYPGGTPPQQEDENLESEYTPPVYN